MSAPLLRVYHSGNPNLSARWFSFTLRGVASGFVTADGIPMLIAEAFKQHFAAQSEGGSNGT